MKIKRDNYEAFFMDYLDGNLDESVVNDFIEFLQQNPDLKEELTSFESVSLHPEDITFNQKNKLFKERLDSEDNFNKAAIDYIEEEISDTEKVEFQNYLDKHPEKKRDYALFSLTKLHPDESIVFRNKNKIRRRTIGKTILLWSGSVAAILILAFGIFTFIDRSSDVIAPSNTIAELEDKDKKTESPVDINKVPVDQKKKDPVKLKKETTKPPLKKPDQKAKPKNSLRESTEGRMNHEDLLVQRTPVEVPSELVPLTASLNISQTRADLAVMYLSVPGADNNYTDERLLADVVKEKTGIDKFRFNTITKAGLNLVSNISGEKFRYATDENGNVVKYKYDSRLLAFSIKGKKARPE